MVCCKDGSVALLRLVYSVKCRGTPCIKCNIRCVRQIILLDGRGGNKYFFLLRIKKYSFLTNENGLLLLYIVVVHYYRIRIECVTSIYVQAVRIERFYI